MIQCAKKEAKMHFILLRYTAVQVKCDSVLSLGLTGTGATPPSVFVRHVSAVNNAKMPNRNLPYF